VRALLSEFFGAYFNFESKLWRTLWVLVRRPGALTVEYLRGRRTRYFGPIRLYLTVSFLFFLIVALFGRADVVKVHPAETSSSMPDAKASADTRVFVIPGLPALEARLNSRAHELEALPEEAKANAIRAALGIMLSDLPKVLFVLLPVFAAFFKLAFFRRYYAEVFVFVLHLHSFVFLALLPGVLAEGANRVFLPAAVVYGALAMRRVFQQSWAWTLVKGTGIALAYTTALVLALVAMFGRAMLQG
jgi:hypothetical protein